MSFLTKSALAALLLAGTLGAANAQQASRQIQVIAAEPAAAAQVAQAPVDPNAQADAKAPAVVETPAPAPAPEVKAEPAPAPAIVTKKIVRVADPHSGYASNYGYAPRYREHCGSYRGGYRGY
jgi:outer membrane biosynthesis protein TonB